MHHEWHPDDASSPVNGLFSECLWGDRYTMCFDSGGPVMIDTGHQNGQTSRDVQWFSEEV